MIGNLPFFPYIRINFNIPFYMKEIKIEINIRALRYEEATLLTHASR